MSWMADKKRAHESDAESALKDKNYSKAFFHTTKAAELGFTLAEQSDGKIALRYVEDAHDLIDLAAQLKTKAATQDKRALSKAVKEGKAEEDDTPPSSWMLQEKPDIKLDDVAGLADVKETLREKVIAPFEHPEVFQRFRAKTGAGVLMYGPPGNGKTYIAKAIAGEVDAAFFPIDLAEVKSKYVGDTAKNLKAIFAEASNHPRAVLFLDEVDALLSRRGNRKVDSVAQFLSLTDGLTKSKNCLLVLAATNRPWSLDDAVVRPGRLGTKVYVGLPDAPAREAILRVHLKDVPFATDLALEKIAADTEGYSGAEMADICDRAKMSAIKRQLASGKNEQVTAADFAAAREKVKPGTTREMLDSFVKWRDAGAKPAGEDDDE